MRNGSGLALLCGLVAACDGDRSAAPDERFAAVPETVFVEPGSRAFASGRVLIGFSEPPDDQQRARLPGTLRRWMPTSRIALVDVAPGADVLVQVEALRASGEYAWVEPDYVRQATATVDDRFRSVQWNLDAVDAEGAWEQSTGEGIVVAVIDTGVTSGPNDGIGGLLEGFDFVNDDTDASDDNGHGTHVAGTIAQTTNNAAGVAGLAFDAEILPVKVLDAAGSGFSSDIIAGIEFAVDNGADVINLSLGSSTFSAAEAAAIAAAHDAGVFIAAASGNDAAGTVSFPAGYPEAVAVGATGFGEALAPYSNTGAALDLVAPGGDLAQDLNGDGFVDGILQETDFGAGANFFFLQGTSMAAPHVAAAAALLMANGATHEEAEAYLKETARDLGAPGRDDLFGAGFIQPAAALAAFEADFAEVPPCGGFGEQRTGTLPSGGRVLEPDGRYYYASSGTHDAAIDEGIGLELFQYSFSRRGWVRIAQSSVGTLSHSGTAGYYTWRLTGSTGQAYDFCLTRP
ncbi:MAG: S8 family serine peptidase [Myxococcota bacterium]